MTLPRFIASEWNAVVFPTSDFYFHHHNMLQTIACVFIDIYFYWYFFLLRQNLTLDAPSYWTRRNTPDSKYVRCAWFLIWRDWRRAVGRFKPSLLYWSFNRNSGDETDSEEDEDNSLNNFIVPDGHPEEDDENGTYRLLLFFFFL